MMFRGLSFILLFLTSVLGAYSQADSTLVDFESYLQMIRSNHPLYKQADLLLESGDANMRRARGNFDPVLKSAYDNKQFGGKDYYRLNDNQVKIPTVLGLELKAGYENNSGTFLNPENQMPENGLAYAGISMPLGNGLFFDERRQALRQAEIYDRATDLQRQLMLNDLVFEASKAYWDWYSAWNTLEILEEAVTLAEFRFQGVKQSFIQGDLPAIDTLEAFIQVQNRELSKNDALIRLSQTLLEVSNYMWSDDMEPLLLSPESRPLSYKEVQMDSPPANSIISDKLPEIHLSHPQLLLYNNKLEHLNIERKWKAEKLKPKLNVNYNFLNQPVGGNPFEGYSTNDYKWGFEFSMPLLLRQERGDLQITKLKISETDLELRRKKLEIQNKIKAYKTEIDNIYTQIALFKNAVENYEALLRGEKRKFEEGESSLFLVNSRETSVITAEIKLVELLGKYQKAQAGFLQAMGNMDQYIL